MSGVLRRGSLSFNCNLNENNSTSPRGNTEFYREGQQRTPEISVLSLDFKRLSQDLKKKETQQIEIPNESAIVKDLSQDIDSDVISNFIGHYGWWQFVWTFVLCLFQIPPTFQMFAFVFQTAEKPYWCARPPAFSDMDVTAWINLTQPHNTCSMMNVSNLPVGTSFLDYFNQNLDTMNFVDCTNFEYSTKDGDAVTLVQEFNLVCNRKNFLSVVEMCFLAGAAVGSVSSGWLSDSFGRKQTLMGFTFVQTVFGTVLTFSTSLAMYMTLRVIIGFASMTLAVVSFVLVVELVSGKWRTIIGILNILPVAISYVLTAGIAYYIRDWRTLQLVITIPGWVLLTIWYCVPESPRWLLARGRLNELYNLIERAAKMNGITLPSNYQKSLEAAIPTTPEKPQPATVETVTTVAECRDTTKTATSNGIQNEATASDNTDNNNTSIKFNKPDIDCNANPLVVVFSKKYWRTTCLTLIVWLTLIIIYFGLTLHLSSLGGNIYLTTAVAGTVEGISICLSIFTVLKFGIRRNLITFMLVPGICCLATNLVPAAEDSSNSLVVIGLAIIAKCVIGANNAIIPTYTAMQYPTIVRNFALGMGNLAAGAALILVPYMWLLENIQPLLPMTIMGVSGIIGAIALVLMKDIE